MLGKIIEQLENTSLHEAFKTYVFKPLKLKSTYLIEKDSDFSASMYYKHEALYRPNLWRSLPACGGCMVHQRNDVLFKGIFQCFKT